MQSRKWRVPGRLALWLAAALLSAAGINAQAKQPAPLDFDGDGLSDFAVVRNTGGGPTGAITWFVVTSGKVLHTALDFDGDGISDFVVVRNTGGGPTGAITWFSVVSAGTWTVITPHLEITKPNASQVRVVFNTVVGKSYQLQYETNAEQHLWLVLTNHSGTGGLVTNTYTITGTPSRYYRVLMQ